LNMIEPTQLNFNKLNGLIPCVVQDPETRVVLMLGFMNEEALKKTISDKRVTFFSRSKQRLWTKGESSGNYLELIDLMVDCDQDTLLIKAKPNGPVCHTGSATCFNEQNESQGIDFLERVIQERKKNPKSGSYTNSLLESGINKIAVELVIEAKDNNRELFLSEAADLMYHYLVLLTAKDIKLSEVEKVLRKRHSESSMK
jgi:phosphoribosyl-AMP cyclohydrolase / phosphoribosyl-ATP pyrophosphohydrolase